MGAYEAGLSGLGGPGGSTPMMRQYREMKARDPEALLLFRMGDFYEMFGADAERAGALLGLTVTTRDRDKGPDALPMAGFPHPALESYLARLVQSGVRAAVCDQVEDARFAKGLVKREIVRVVTPGTLTDDAMLDPKTSNYLAAVVEHQGKTGLAWVELSLGRFQLAAMLRQDLCDEFARLQPAELLVSETCLDAPWVRSLRSVAPKMAVTPRPSWDFVLDQARTALCEHFRTATLRGFGVDDDGADVQAAGALLVYLKETQKSALGHLCQLEPYRRGSTLLIDDVTRRGLELTRTLREGKREGALIHVVDRTVTAMGARMLAEWLNAPLTDADAIRDRQDLVELLVRETALRDEIRNVLEKVQDLERLAARVGTNRATPRDLVGVARTLGQLPALKALLSHPQLRELDQALVPCPDLQTTLSNALVDDPPLALKEGGLIREGYHPYLDELRDAARGGKSWIAKYQSEQIRRTGIKNIKVGFNKIFGYYIEITKAQDAKFVPPADYVRKQTLTGAERYITPELKEYEDKVLRAEEQAKELEFELFVGLRDRTAGEAPRLIQAALVLAKIDVLAGLAELAARQGYCRPVMVAEPVLELESGRHPVLDARFAVGQFVPNDTFLGLDHGFILLITGPNMAGKSTYIRQVALIVLLAQIGGFVPAARARIGIVDRIFARIGATDELGRGQSTFMVEMTETANILHNATENSLVILDEIGRGTSTFDGISLAWAIIEHLHDNVRCRTLFATHYHELVELEKIRPHVRNANVAVRENAGEIVFLHRIAPGGADQSYGIHVARLAGVPDPVLARARVILAFLERQHLQDQELKGDPPPATTAQSPLPALNADGSTATIPDDPSANARKSMPDSNAAAAAAPVSEPEPVIPRAKSGRALRQQASLFAAIPDPILEELQSVDVFALSPDEALDLVKRLRRLVM